MHKCLLDVRPLERTSVKKTELDKFIEAMLIIREEIAQVISGDITANVTHYTTNQTQDGAQLLKL